MPFERLIWGEKNCSRCNAIAQLRSYARGDKMVELRLDCKQCKLSRFEELTTQKELDFRIKEERWLNRLEKSTSARQRNAILKKLEYIRKERLRVSVYPDA
jgi:hypothetical protein